MSKITPTELQLVIWRNIQQGVGQHGDFLKSFAVSFIRADFPNRLILCDVSKELIAKYDLNKYPYTNE